MDFSAIEHRLDCILVRANFCTSINEARQMILHKQVLVNGVFQRAPSFLVNNFDYVSLAGKYKLKCRKQLSSWVRNKHFFIILLLTCCRL